jgi:glutamate synthase (NADPH/NADH) small chain
VEERVRDWHEVYEPASRQATAEQAARCMSCGTPFCHSGCPMGNLIPEWNDLVQRERWQEASDRLHATNNFPEITGRVCPAICEASCVLSINDQPVTVAPIEKVVAEIAWTEGWVVPRPAAVKTGRRVAVVGSGPAGLAASQQLARAGHHVVVYERADRLGGLLRYGIPEFKLEKRVLERRLDQMRAEGISFETGIEVGTDLSATDLLAGVDALLLAGGATLARDLAIPGRELAGIHQAMEYLTLANRVQEGDLDVPSISARGRHVVVIGGGDTGADCLGTALRQGGASVHQLEIMPRPPNHRDPSTPWPVWPLQLRTSAAHEEGGDRLWSVSTQRFVGDGRGHVAGLVMAEVAMNTEGGRPSFPVVAGTETDLDCDLVLLALGFAGPERSPMLAQLGVDLDNRGTVARDERWGTGREGVFVCGDMSRGQSLVAWAIAEGRSAAAAVDRWLMGETVLRTAIPAALGR